MSSRWKTLKPRFAAREPAEMVDGGPLAESAVDHRYRLLMKMGRRRVPLGRWPSRRATSVPPRRRRGWNAIVCKRGSHLADVQYDRGTVAESIKTLQDLLGEETFRRLNVSAEGGRRSVRSDLLIADRLATIVGTKGRAVYEEYDREAAALLEAGRESGDARSVRRSRASLPRVGGRPRGLAGTRPLAGNRWASRRGRTCLQAFTRHQRRRPPSCPRHARHGPRLRGAKTLGARAGRLRGRRDAYASIALGGDGPDAKTPLGTLALNRLARAPFDRMTGDRAEPTLPAPLSRLWSKPLASSWRPLTAEGVPPTAEAGRIFLANGGDLRPIDANAARPLDRRIRRPPVLGCLP